MPCREHTALTPGCFGCGTVIWNERYTAPAPSAGYVAMVPCDAGHPCGCRPQQLPAPVITFSNAVPLPPPVCTGTGQPSYGLNLGANGGVVCSICGAEVPCGPDGELALHAYVRKEGT